MTSIDPNRINRARVRGARSSTPGDCGISGRPGALQPSGIATASGTLADWRRAAGLTPRIAARHLRLSEHLYRQLERGEGDTPPSLAVEIRTRTGGAVDPATLPGCAITPEQNAEAPGSCGPHGEPAEGAARGVSDAPSEAFPRAWSIACGQRVYVAMSADMKDVWSLDPRVAAQLGLAIIQAAIDAMPPAAPVAAE